MKIKLGQAKSEARALLLAGDYPGALRAFDRILAAMPFDYEIRFKVADLLGKVGMADEAANVYETVARHDIRSGHPLPAVVACHALAALGKSDQGLLELVARTYASGSPQLARFAVRPAPVDAETPLELEPQTEAEPFDTIVERAHRRAIDLSAFVSYQQQFHPLPFFSELTPETLLAVLKHLTVRRLEDGAVVVQQGDPGEALYLVAAGELRVHARGSDGNDRELARLFENTLFGEMALLSNQPRAASVTVVGEADVIEVSRAALSQVVAFIPALREVLDRFARERLIKNLLTTSPLFTPFSKTQQADLLKRFEGLDVAAGTDVIREREPGQGLYVVVQGSLEVLSTATTPSPTLLGKLGTGDIFGEMSLITNQLANATVRTVTPATLLFLGRAYVERLASAVPEIVAYFQAVASRRMKDNTLRLGAAVLPQEPLELDASEAILL